MNTAIVMVVPKIRLIVCPNKDNFHEGVFVSYIISIDCNGDWMMFDEPTPDFTNAYINGNKRVPVDTLFRTCAHCRKRGVK
jgi:hypothetical protein